MRVAAGAIARKILGDGVAIRGAVVQIGTQKIDRANWDWDATGDNPFVIARTYMGGLELEETSTACTGAASCGVIGWPRSPSACDPVYDKLDADLAKALVGINAVKGVESATVSPRL